MVNRGIYAAGSVLAVLIFSVYTIPAYATLGALTGSVTFSQDCSYFVSGKGNLGVGIAFDGTYLWYTCYGSGGNPDLLRADPLTGVVSKSYDINGGLGALAYDSANNAFYIGNGGGSGINSPYGSGSTTCGDIVKVQLDGSHEVTSASKLMSTAATTYCLIDGVGYDGLTGLLYVSPDISSTIWVYNLAGVLQTTFSPSAAGLGLGCGNSGLAIGGSLLFEGFNGCSHVFVVDKVSKAASFDFPTAVAGDLNFRDEGLSCDQKTFAPTQVMWSKEAYSPMRAHAFSVPPGTCGFGGQPAVGGTAIPIDTTALLLYGMQTTALWWVPAIVLGGAGIGLATVKKKNLKSLFAKDD